MNCADLERYLEAFLDGRLGRARAALLRRHMVGCPSCRRRVDLLQEFERDLNRRLRAMGQCESVWAGLELHLVSSADGQVPAGDTVPRALLAPPRTTELPAPRGIIAEIAGPRPFSTGLWATRAFGFVLLVAAGGTVYDGMSTWLASAGSGVPAIYTKLDALKPGTTRELRSTDASAIRTWLSRELGATVPLPPQPGEFRLVGTHLERLGAEDTGVLTYRRGASISQVYLRPTRLRDPDEAADGLREDLHGRARTSWTERDMAYAITSPMTPEQYQPLVRARWSPL